MFIHNKDNWKYVNIEGNNKRYIVSDFGEIMDLKTGRVLRKSLSSNGYYLVSLKLENCFQDIGMSVHKLVAITFLENDNPSEKTVIDHVNGIKTDNRVQNLEWVTPSENTKRAYYNKLIIPRKGEECIQTTTKTHEVNIICKLLVKYNGNISKTYGELQNKGINVSKQVIDQIKLKRSWKDISDQYFDLDRFKFHHLTDDEIRLICKSLIENNMSQIKTYNELKSTINGLNYQIISQIKHKKKAINISDEYF